MKNLQHALFFLLLSSVSAAHAQYTTSWEAAGKTIYAFNKDWRPIDNLDAATYYRKAYKVDDSKFKVLDYYKSGELQMVAYFKEADPAFKEVAYGEKIHFSKLGDTIHYYKYDDVGNKIGKHYSKYDNGEIWFEAEYSNKGKDGLKTWYFENGLVKKTFEIKDNKRVGVYVENHENGQLSLQGPYVNGNRNGSWKAYYENGNNKYVLKYDKGDPIGNYEYFDDEGNKTVQGTYKNGKQEGTWKYWHSNGALQKTVIYKEGNLEGLIKSYTEKGELYSESNYVNGTPVGKHLYYTNGVVTREEIYSDGYPAKKITNYYTSGEKMSVEKKGNITYYGKDGKVLHPKQIQLNPKSETPLIQLISEGYNLPKTKAVSNARGVYSFGITADGNVDTVKVSESITDISDSVLVATIEKLKFSPGTYFGESGSFWQSIIVKIEKGKISDVSEGMSYFTKPASETNLSDNKEFTDNTHDITYTIVEDMPEFPGGEENLFKFLGQEVRYPSEAKDVGVQGVVYISFTVNECGVIQNAKVIRSAHPTIDLEALRVVNSMPVWMPGRQRGLPVNVKYNLPIRFILN